VVAAPVGAPDSVAALAPQVDDLVCLATPFDFHAVSQWYRHFEQTSDAEVQDLLALAWRKAPVRAAHAATNHAALRANNS
jgi:putative phosphoribosyl transferase